MPLVRMKATAAGPEGTRTEGKVYNVSNEEAKSLLEGGYAEPVRGKPVEQATKAPSAEHADESEETPRDGRRGGGGSRGGGSRGGGSRGEGSRGGGAGEDE